MNVGSSSSTPKEKQRKAAGNGTRCCRGFNDCIIWGSHKSIPKLELQVPNISCEKVAELEKEVQKQKELKALYRMRLERTQDYLRYCLQTAQENGFLDIIMSNKDQQHEGILSSDVTTSPQTPPPPPLPVHRHHQQQEGILSSDVITSPQTPPPPPPLPVHRHRDLASLIDQAKANGWYVQPHEIEVHDKVGQGSTAAIYKGTWRELDVAVKCIFPDFFHSNIESGVSFFAQEVETLSRQRHPFVLRLMGACLDPPDCAWLVTEFLSMNLKEWLHGCCPLHADSSASNRRSRERTVPIPPFEERLGKALEIAQAMQYLHEQKPKVIHRDLKPSNIFLDGFMHVRVADFGHARFLNDEEKALTGETGTYVYMAPEVIRCEPYDEKCDVYSFGVILNELITGEHPFIETDYGPSKIAMEVAEGRLRPAIPKDDDDDHQMEGLIELIQLSWDQDAALRPSFSSIVRSLKRIQGRAIDSISLQL